MLDDYDIQAERSTLGAIMAGGNRGYECLLPEHFSEPAHQKIFAAILKIQDRSDPVDVITVCAELKRAGEIDAQNLVYTIAEEVVIGTNAKVYAKQVIDAAAVREHARVIAKSGREIAKPGADASVCRNQLLDELIAIGQRAKGGGTETTKQMGARHIALLDKRRSGGMAGASTGFYDLDGLLGGLCGGTMNVIAARPAMGKTSAAFDIVRNFVREKKRCLVFSLEMPKAQCLDRLLAAEARINIQRIRTGMLRDAEWPKLSNAYDRAFNDYISINDRSGLSISEMRGLARQWAGNDEPGLIVIDYLQLATGDKGEGREREVASIATGAKDMSKELDCPVIAVAQLNRAVEARSPPKPMLRDLRESGGIEQDADTVTFIYREGYYDEKADQGTAEFMVSKNRHGPTGNVNVRWVGKWNTFQNLIKGA